jgi:hypothetical protein
LHEIADRSAITIKAPHVITQDPQVPLEISLTFDKHDKKKVLSELSTIGAQPTTELPTNEQQTGCLEWPTKMTKSKISSCKNYGGRRIFKMPEPNSLGEGSSL